MLRLSVEGVKERLVFTEAEDGLPLEGAVIEPADTASTNQAIVWIHGGASKFYERHYVAVGREFAARGYPCVMGNTRGHDAFTLIQHGEDVVLAGGSFERFDQSPYDLAAWIDLAMTLGVESVVLVGHSLGASKAVYYAAARQDARVRGVVAASPIEGWESNAERVALADRMVGEGQGDRILPHSEGTPNWNIVSAQTVLTKEQVIKHVFNSETTAPSMSQLDCPLLVLYGALEEVDAGWLQTLQGNAGSRGAEIRTIAQAGHEYAGQEAAVAHSLVEWLRSIE